MLSLKARTLPFKPVPVGGEDLLFLQYTGGTTGVSKGAALSHRNLVANTEQFKAFMPGRTASRPGSRGHGAAALSHLRADGELHQLLSPSAPRTGWSPTRATWTASSRSCGKARPTVFTGVNTLFGGLLMHPKIADVDFSSLRVAIGGGAAVLPTTSAKWKALTGKDILEGYGLSETSPILTLNPMTATGFSATVGLPLPSTDIKLLDEDDKEAAIGEPGEICAKGPQVMSGYWQKPEANAAAFTAGRLLPHRRHRRVRRRRLPQDRRSQEGHDHRLGLQRLSERGRGGRGSVCRASPNAPASAGRTRRPAKRCGCSSSRRPARR